MDASTSHLMHTGQKRKGITLQGLTAFLGVTTSALCCVSVQDSEFPSSCLFLLCCDSLPVPADCSSCRDGNRSGRKSEPGRMHLPLCFASGHCCLFQQIPLPEAGVASVDLCLGRGGEPVLCELAGSCGNKPAWSLDLIIPITEYSFARSWNAQWAMPQKCITWVGFLSL